MDSKLEKMADQAPLPPSLFFFFYNFRLRTERKDFAGKGFGG